MNTFYIPTRNHFFTVHNFTASKKKVTIKNRLLLVFFCQSNLTEMDIDESNPDNFPEANGAAIKSNSFFKWPIG